MGDRAEEKFSRALRVEAKPNEDVESLLRRFKKKLKRDNRFLEIRKHDHFVSASEKKREKKRRRKLSDGRDIRDS